MDRASVTHLLSRLSSLSSPSEEADLLDDLADPTSTKILAFLNRQAINLARRSPAFLDSISASTYLLRDGTGAKWLCKFFGKAPGINCCGTDVIPRLLSRFSGRRIALCGTSAEHVALAAKYARDSGCAVVVALDGFAESSAYVEAIRTARPELVVIGMGMPKQEIIACQLARHVGFPITIVCGGAILDYWAGRFARAPKFVRSAGAEWIFRLALEPRRLWRRYLIGNLSFLAWLISMRLRNPSWRPVDGLPTGPR